MSETKLVYKAIAKTMLDLVEAGGIGKNQENQQQRFKFRGVDDVYNALAPILSKNGLAMIPRVTERVITERQSKSGGALFHTVLRVEYDFVASEDGSIHTAIVYGEAMDSGDKGASKALSIAFKYAAFQTFCIPVEGDDSDPDAKTHDVASRENPQPTPARPVARKPQAPPSGKPSGFKVKKVEEKEYQKKDGTTGIRYAVYFADGPIASTFSSTLGGHAKRHAKAQDVCHPELIVNGKYTNLEGFSCCQDEDEAGEDSWGE